MSNIVSASEKSLEGVESALVMNDLSKMTTKERISYVKALCDSVGLNHLTNPFAYITLQGKLTLYATKNASEQLRKIHGVSTQIVSMKQEGDFYQVHIKAQDKTGKTDEDIASIVTKGMSANDLANAQMKCVTKAKRRVTLSICGLGMLDESEIETIRNVTLADNPQVANPLVDECALSEPEVLESENDLGSFVIKVGKKYLGKRLDEVDQFELNSFVEWVVKTNKEKNQELTGDWKEFVESANQYLDSREYKKENNFGEIPF